MKDMKFTFKYSTKAMDLWKLSMYGIYGSMVGLVNIIFTIALILLTAKYWMQVNIMFKILLIMGVGLFTFIQPLLVYLKAKKQVKKIPDPIELSFNNQGVHIHSEKEASHLEWKSIKGITKKPGMLILIASSRHGFILTDDVLGAQKDEFYHYVLSKIS
jgi:hypothetical protein